MARRKDKDKYERELKKQKNHCISSVHHEQGVTTQSIYCPILPQEY